MDAYIWDGTSRTVPEEYPIFQNLEAAKCLIITMGMKPTSYRYLPLVLTIIVFFLPLIFSLTVKDTKSEIQVIHFDPSQSSLVRQSVSYSDIDKLKLNELVRFVTAPETRGTFTVVWSCLATYILCAWTMTHIDIVPCAEGKYRLWYRFLWALWALTFPELLCIYAGCQYFEARKIHKAMKKSITREEPRVG
jgi:hypothetical protein